MLQNQNPRSRLGTLGEPDQELGELVANALHAHEPHGAGLVIPARDVVAPHSPVFPVIPEGDRPRVPR